MRNIEATKAKILNAAKVILQRDGFENLKLNKLAAEAGVGKPLIYRYFGGLDGLKEALANEVRDDFILSSEGVGGKTSSQIIEDLLLGGRELAADRLTRDLLLWSLSSNHAPTKRNEIALGNAEHVATCDDKQAVYAILKAAIAFVVLYRDRHKAWAGLPLDAAKDMARLENALAKIVERSWA